MSAGAGDVEIFGGRTGSFEITRGDEVLFSKLDLGRFPEDDEIPALVA
ncbi:MAG: Rdx family protein [bacterium]|nr:Rdx family protein [bacterium]MDE0242680.1 Rdx family protein [bacterium]MDE0416035.1 Rdx family protein [bacterium]